MSIKNSHKLIYLLSIMLTMISWIFALYYWDKLPQIIPVHFGFSGQADRWDHKSLFYVYLIPVLQTIMTIFFAWLYRYPQYSNIPSTLWLSSLDKEQREKSYNILRNMQTGTLILVNLLLTYLSISILLSATGSHEYPSPVIMIVLVAAMLGWIVWYSLRSYKIISDFIKQSKKGGK